MDETQKAALFRAIAISTASSPALMPLVTHQSRAEAFNTLEEFKKFDGRVAVILDLLRTESHALTVNGQAVDITASAKLYTLSVLQSFLKTNYAKVSNENERLALRDAVITAARQLLAKSTSSNTSHDPVTENVNRFLAVKIAALIADIATRDFPQRWTSFISDIFAPPDKGGLWYIPTEMSSIKGYGPMIGVKMCLECLKIITEDCTDGDFNSKISTSRRNDVLIGLNEVNAQFLPLMFELISNQYSIVNAAKSNLNEMHNYLISNSRTIAQMTAQEKPMYDEQILRRDNAGRIVADCLKTLEKFCQSMPTDWMLSNQNNCDFIAALLHLLREETAQLQTLSVACLHQIVQRKIDLHQWLRIVSSLPPAISDANDACAEQDKIKAAAEGHPVDNMQVLVDKFPFHRALSKMMAITISAHVAHITTDRDIMKDRGPKFQTLSAFLGLLADMLSHPSPRICGEQNSTWSVLLRDPQVAKTETRLLQPCFERILVSYTTHLVRTRWEDVEEQTHQYAALLEETFSDKTEYEQFVGDFRSKANITIRQIAGIDPKLATTVIQQKFEYLFSTYARGDIRDHLDPTNGQLTQQSTAVMELEGINQPIDNLIRGMPEWALDDSQRSDPSFMDPNRVTIRNFVRAALGEIASKVTAWAPTDIWLKFRRVTLLESLKGYWQYDASRLIGAVSAILDALGEEGSSGNGLTSNLSGDVVSLRKRSGSSLISITKRVTHLLVGWLGQLSERVKTLLSMQSILPFNRMHLYEFLSCVATAVQDPIERSKFIADVLSDALNNLNTPLVNEALSSPDGLMNFLGITQAGIDPSSVTDKANVGRVSNNFTLLFSIFNQLLSVGKRCHEAAKKRPNAGLPVPESQLRATENQDQHNYPDEGAISINDLSINDPFVHLWPTILPPLMQCLDVLFTLWHPEHQMKYFKHSIQRYAYAISDDEAYLAKNQNSSSGGGVFGEGGTAGSVVTGWDRRACNLAPKWSGWFNELRNTCLQLLGLLSAQRALYSPELSSMYQSFVNVIANPVHLKCMEHRHMTQYIKQFIDYVMLSCPSTLYQSHVAPIVAPFFEHMEFRLKCTWAPILNPSGSPPNATNPLGTADYARAVDSMQSGGDAWIQQYYARGCVFVGDLDSVTSEAVVEKSRVEVSRCFADMLQTALALKGDWALVLANLAKEEQAAKKNDAKILTKGPSSKVLQQGGPLNADGTKRSKVHLAVEARKRLRIHKLCHFLLLENETIAGYLVLSVAECLNYPDAYTCRRCTKISHRILETVAWVDRYTQLLGTQMFTNVVRAVVFEQKWMVGMEWDMINLIRDLYCRLVLGQSLQCGGQGLAMQQPRDATGTRYEQAKTVDEPLQGGGILCNTTDLPRVVLTALPGIDANMVVQVEEQLKNKPGPKDQKDSLRDILRVAAENLKQTENSGQDMGILGRADASESMLSLMGGARKDLIQGLPEKLVTHSMMLKNQEKATPPSLTDYGSSLFG